MTGTKMRRKPPKPYKPRPRDAKALETVAMLTEEARVVMSRMKEPGAVALSLPEMAMVIDPGLPGLLVSARADEQETAWQAHVRRFDPFRTTENLELDDRQRANLFQRTLQPSALPVEHRLLPDGGLLPALGDHPLWGVSLQRARAVIVELETLDLLVAVEVRGASVSEKWTTTAFGKRVCGAVSVHEWRQAKSEAGKSEG